MNNYFSVAIAETRDDFIKIVSGNPVTFFEVYSENPAVELERLFNLDGSGYAFVRFNMGHHSPQARLQFLHLDDLTKKVYNFPPEMRESPLPYFSSFVRPFGKTGLAWTKEEVNTLIRETLKEEEIARKTLLTTSSS
ncbi:hypothetical protein KIH39_21580 [Telmatocola sphagniphila]|uniref:Uncharacterized protein n=1 Tax=Telmatocola sphagniphila TaxID=1123043 RepID=A0A8E6B4X0_9BACT|nr:hypothetical protein [Telmatocola sphagniphila]QVL31412.1 hypothetical protein KIH39_21580 [Telmatocola sphagniphila]